jgi:hypothetical protein
MTKQIQHKSTSIERYTPPEVMKIIHDFFGDFGIDLDPCSCEKANTIVQAKRIFTKETDGYIQDWKAKTLFCNPPFGRSKPALRHWTPKIINENKKGNFEVGLYLTPVNACTKWFSPLWKYPILFYGPERITFYGEDMKPIKDAAGMGIVISCITESDFWKEKFIKEMRELNKGFVYNGEGWK